MKKHIGEYLVIAHRFHRSFEAALKLIADTTHRQRQEKIHPNDLVRIAICQLAFGTVVFDNLRFTVKQHCTDGKVVKCWFSELIECVRDVNAIDLKKIFIRLQ